MKCQSLPPDAKPLYLITAPNMSVTPDNNIVRRIFECLQYTVETDGSS